MNLLSAERIIVFFVFLAKFKINSADQVAIHCVTEKTFAVHVIVFQQVIETALVLYCPPNHHCVANSNMPCQSQTDITPTGLPSIGSTPQPNLNKTTTQITTISQSTTTKPPEPECIGPGYHQAIQCNEYYECVPAFWWYKPMLRSCANGYFYSATRKPCDKPPNVVCNI